MHSHGPTIRQPTFPRRITEESEGYGLGGSSDEEAVAEELNVVENPRFGKAKTNGFSIRSPPAVASDIGPRSNSEDKERKGSGFFGSIRGLFKGSGKDKDRESNSTRESGSTERHRSIGGDKKWATRTDQNLKAAKRGKDGDSSDDDTVHVRGARLAMSDVGPSSSSSSPKLRKKSTVRKERERVDTQRTVMPARNDGLAARELGEQSVSRWIDDGHAVVEAQGDGQATVKKKRKGTIKKPKAKATAAKPNGSSPAAAKATNGQVYVVPAAEPNVNVANGGSTGGGLSRSESTSPGSITSAPANSSRARRASTISNTHTNAGSGSTNIITAPVPKRASSMHTPKSSGTKNGTQGQGHERRASGPAAKSGAVGPDQSLMGIVEGASKANRQGWQTHQSSKSTPLPTAGAGLGLGMHLPKAPARVTRDDLDYALPMIQANVSMAIPKAPPSIFANGNAAAGNGDAMVGNGNGNGNVSAPPKMPSIVAPVPFKPIPGGTLKAGSTSSLGPPKPLKSALRGSSRSPSPNPWFPQSSPQSTPPPVPRLPQQITAEPEQSDQSAPAKTTLSSRNSDVSSISSYETGHENLYEEEETPPAPPAHDHAASDVSASTASTQTPVAPARRKSVRVSLRPTFSPTPPAFDDEESHAPWGDSTITDPPSRQKAATDVEKDIWEDSSDEDEEYRKARKLLSRAGKKKKASK